MHLIYRSRKQTLPLVQDHKLAPYMASLQQSPPPLLQKKSIEIILDKHITPFTPSTQALACYKPHKKTLYRASKSRKAESGHLRAGSSEHHASKGAINRNKSVQMVDKTQAIRKRGQSDYSPYILGQRKSGSSGKLRVPAGGQPEERDWICARLIERQVYCVEQRNDFS